MSQRWIMRQAMGDWVGLTAQSLELEPNHRRMDQELLASGYVQANETLVRCNDPDEKHGGTSQGPATGGSSTSRADSF